MRRHARPHVVRLVTQRLPRCAAQAAPRACAATAPRPPPQAPPRVARRTCAAEACATRYGPAPASSGAPAGAPRAAPAASAASSSAPAASPTPCRRSGPRILAFCFLLFYYFGLAARHARRHARSRGCGAVPGRQGECAGGLCLLACTDVAAFQRASNLYRCTRKVPDQAQEASASQRARMRHTVDHSASGTAAACASRDPGTPAASSATRAPPPNALTRALQQLGCLAPGRPGAHPYGHAALVRRVDARPLCL